MSLEEDYAGKTYIAFDFASMEDERATELLNVALEFNFGIKIGTIITARHGWIEPIKTAQKYTSNIFVDTKLCDSPATVSQTAWPILETRPKIIDIHASAGEKSLATLLEVREATQPKDVAHGFGTLAIAVTVLTPKTEAECKSEYGRSPSEQTRYYTDMALDLGYDGVACSGRDAAMLRADPRMDGKVILVPAVYPDWAPIPKDQERTVNHIEAFQNGATHVVAGRCVTNPPPSVGRPRQAALRFIREVVSKV